MKKFVFAAVIMISAAFVTSCSNVSGSKEISLPSDSDSISISVEDSIIVDSLDVSVDADSFEVDTMPVYI